MPTCSRPMPLANAAQRSAGWARTNWGYTGQGNVLRERAEGRLGESPRAAFLRSAGKCSESDCTRPVASASPEKGSSILALSTCKNTASWATTAIPVQPQFTIPPEDYDWLLVKHLLLQVLLACPRARDATRANGSGDLVRVSS